jgi:hypothetical protein
MPRGGRRGSVSHFRRPADTAPEVVHQPYQSPCCGGMEPFRAGRLESEVLRRGLPVDGSRGVMSRSCRPEPMLPHRVALPGGRGKAGSGRLQAVIRRRMTTANDRQRPRTTRSSRVSPTKQQVSASAAGNYDVRSKAGSSRRSTTSRRSRVRLDGPGFCLRHKGKSDTDVTRGSRRSGWMNSRRCWRWRGGRTHSR